MKRRAEQLTPHSTGLPQYHENIAPTTNSVEGQDSSEISERVLFKSKPLSPPKGIPSAFESLLASLKSDDIAEQTEKFLQSFSEQTEEAPTPRLILAQPSPQRKLYEVLHTVNAKFNFNDKWLGKGTVEILRSGSGKVHLLIFRNCIRNILFTGAFISQSALIKTNTACKDKHEDKIDFTVELAMQPGGKLTTCLLCIREKDAEDLASVIAGVAKAATPRVSENNLKV